MSCSNTTLEFLYLFSIKFSANRNNVSLTQITLITNHQLSWGDFTFESIWFSKHCDIMFACWKRTVYPSKLVFIDSNPKLIIKSWAITLMTIPLCAWRLMWFANWTMRPINTQNEYRLIGRITPILTNLLKQFNEVLET